MIEAVAGQGGRRVVAVTRQEEVVAQAAEQVDEVGHAALGEVLEDLRHQGQRGMDRARVSSGSSACSPGSAKKAMPRARHSRESRSKPSAK